MNNDGSAPVEPMKFKHVGTETDTDGNITELYEVDDDTAESFFREDLELAEQWLADIKSKYATELMRAEAEVNQRRRELHEFLAERHDGR